MITRKRILTAIRNSFGNITIIAQRLNCDRKTVYNWLEKDEKVKEEFESERDKIIDVAESQMIKKVNDGSDAMISLVLKTLGKKRGYVEKSEIDSNEKVEITVVNNLKE